MGEKTGDSTSCWIRRYEILAGMERAYFLLRALRSTFWWLLMPRWRREKKEEILSFESLTRCTKNEVARIIAGMIRLDFMSFDRIKNL